jgi:hypothetical protein
LLRSPEVLAATFNTHLDELPNFPFTTDDGLIVTRTNRSTNATPGAIHSLPLPEHGITDDQR